jgi:hypothetical protein
MGTKPSFSRPALAIVAFRAHFFAVQTTNFLANDAGFIIFLNDLDHTILID